MRISDACSILEIESLSSPGASAWEREDLMASAKKNYLTLLRRNHPDVGGSHETTIKLITAFKFLQTNLPKTYRTFTEQYAINCKNQKKTNRSRAKAIKLRPYYGKSPKAVVQMDMQSNFIANWTSISLAARTLKLSQESVSRCCTGKIKYTGGFKWKYSNTI